MGFLSIITDIFDTIFRSSSPEVQKRVALKKIEGEIKAYQPQLYKNEYLSANFAELFRVLYENTKPIEEILSTTICSADLHRNGKFEYNLIMTGFSEKNQQKFEALNFENRKKEVIESDVPMHKVFEAQRRSIESLLKQMTTKEFAKIEDTLARLRQLGDVCRFNYMDVIHAFDPNYSGISSSEFSPVKPVPPEAIVSQLQDFYYLVGNLSIDQSCLRAILALCQLKTGRELSAEEKESIAGNLQKISTVFTKMLTPEIIKKILIFGKKEPAFNPQMASYGVNSLKKFLDYVMGRFNSDEEKIKSEIKDSTISLELQKLFPEQEMFELNGYNNKTNEVLRENTPYSLLWITPLQTLKTFLSVFYSEGIRNLLNNIVIEGFFNNATYKSEFSASVYACNETANAVAEFEKSFEHGEKNDRSLIEGYISDSRRDAAFLKKLASFVDNINEEAHKLLQTEVTHLFSLFKGINDLLIDSRKTKSVFVSNIKVLFSSTRNRDASGLLEQQHDSWRLFLEIMKNYVVVGELDKGNDGN